MLFTHIERCNEIQIFNEFIQKKFVKHCIDVYFHFKLNFHFHSFYLADKLAKLTNLSC